jgi:TonB family protein
MAIVLEREIERAVENRLTPARPRPAPVVRFSPLFAEPAPAARRGRRALLWVSVAVHVALFVTVMLLPRRAQTLAEPSLPIQVVFMAPMPEVPEQVLPKTPPPPKPQPKRAPPPLRRDDPPPVAAKPEPVVKAAIESEPPPVAKVEPPHPRPAVRTGLLDEIAGPAIAASPRSNATIVSSGFDAIAKAGTSRAATGRVMEVAAFDLSPSGARVRRPSGGVVRETGFAEEPAPAAPKPIERAKSPSALDRDVEILSRPKPIYTEEARGLRLEGDVVLNVVFEAAGVLRILDVAQGLGHGLDEAAIDAARKIRFNPARRDGAPVDYAAKLRVVFRLA